MEEAHVVNLTILIREATLIKRITVTYTSLLYRKFIAAEAYFKAGNNENALARLNEVRRRAQLNAVTSIDVDAILKERACELFGQGSRWIDLRRTRKLVEYNNLYNPQIKGRAQQAIGNKLLRPIPQAAIDANELMSTEDQNPGY